MKPNPSFFARRHDVFLILFLIVILLLIIFAWPDPASGAVTLQSATLIPTTTPSPIPAEFLESPDQTNGIICGSVVLILIIVGGTLGILSRQNGSSTTH